MRSRSGGLAGALLLLAAVALRWRALGNPVIHIDEQFYFLVGGRMLEGALPFVDIFDRKPVGLFLIYAACRWIGGASPLAYQVPALLCAWATALLIHGLARRFAGPIAALGAGLLYLVWLTLAGGEGGQAPVFYTPLVAGAAALIARRLAGSRPAGWRGTGCAAMLLIGLALQIKYSVVFEGLYLGLVLLAAAWRDGRRPAALALDALVWIGCALLPTAAAAAWYGAIGQGGAWYFANIASILARRPEAPAMVAERIRVMLALMLPLVLAVPLRRWTGARPTDAGASAALRFVDGWAASALLGVVLFGTWFNHYALPLFAPFAAAAAPLGRRTIGRVYLVLALAIGTVWGQRLLLRHQHSRGDARVLAAATAAARGATGCLFVYDGYPAWYDTTHSCLPTTRPFPAHLQALNEQGATGIDEVREVRRIMDARPSRVMTLTPRYAGENLAARAIVAARLARGYRVLLRAPIDGRILLVYARRDTVPADRPALTLPR
ncbi:ArnT family glycosyltransferase [Sphingomonas morindae]|uniref:Glycosyltransferase RgtA/B/C/D-like domain-containing protein n=1 Tax=Sphingomonas morindae TaxID=1541170 RepID=A0ABY4X4K9_9SPHN|nr:hypothetical protein [Sphingomonas morindae]USI71795.1 hypothetical protein LHA26_10725 [Sphingomonas morindae]